jgi:Ni,Fe-hydrogenase III component G
VLDRRSEIRLGDEVDSRTLSLVVFLVLEVAKERVPWVSLFTDEPPEECAVQSLVDEWPAGVFSLTDEDVVLDR